MQILDDPFVARNSKVVIPPPAPVVPSFKMRWGFLVHLKTFMTLRMAQDKAGWENGGKSGTFEEIPPDKMEDEDDLDLTVIGCKGAANKRWSLGSDSNGEYAQVQNGIESDLEKSYDDMLCRVKVNGQSTKFEDNLRFSIATEKAGHRDHVSKKNHRVSYAYGEHVAWEGAGNVKSARAETVEKSFDKNYNEENKRRQINGGVDHTHLSTKTFGVNGNEWVGVEGTAGQNPTISNNGVGVIVEDKWRVLFDQFDPEGFGEIPWPDFRIALRSTEFRTAIQPGKLLLLEDMAMAESLLTYAITFQHFVNIMSGKRSRSFKCAVHHRDREVCSESDFHLFPTGYTPPSGVERMARLIADEFLTDERDRKYYADHYRCLPPPLFIISVTLIELGFFTYYTMWHGELSSSGPLPIDSAFVYRPDKRLEVWRFIFYMVLHGGWVHLMFNLLVQLLVGLPLEMVHGSLRIGCVYMAGVLAGSLGTSVFDPDVYLVGASGGVYALLAAHLANVLLNYNNMEFGLVRLLGVFIIASADVGFAIYDRYAVPSTLLEGSMPPVSYVAHLTGALAGLTIGLLVLKNFEQKLREQMMWWLALGVYGACTLFAVLFNIFHRTPNA